MVLKKRHGVTGIVGTLIAVLVSGAALASTASASVLQQCSGSNVTGQGASVLSLAFHEVFIPGFGSSTNAFACSGTQGSKGLPVITYTNTGSGAGLKSWGANASGEHKYEPTNAYIGTSEAPNATQKAEIEAGESVVTPNTLQTVPLLQFADVILINLPTGCTATSTSFPGRLVLSDATLEGIWRGTINQWSEITDNGDKLSGGGCNPASPITRVVRKDSSGTAHFLKKYLFLQNTATFTDEKGLTKTWDEESEGTSNIVWPKAINAIKTTVNGELAEDELVSKTAGSIGFGNLAEVRASKLFTPPTGGANTQFFWAPIQDKTGEKAKYADPATNQDVAELGDANCAKTIYTNGETAFPPASVNVPWNEVTTSLNEKGYPICGLAFALAFNKYSAYPGTTEAEATSVENFLSYAVDSKADGGQVRIKGHDYSPLSKTILKLAQAGVRGAKKTGLGGTGF